MLDLAGVNARTDPQVERDEAVHHRERTPDCARGALEGREEAVPGGLDLLTAEDDELAPSRAVVRREELAPRAVAEALGGPRRADDVRDENGR